MQTTSPRHATLLRWQIFLPYLLLACGAGALIIGIWLAIASRTKVDLKNAEVQALTRADTSARNFEQFALRTLKAADNITKIAIVSIENTSPTEMINRAKKTNIIDGEMFASLNVQDEHGYLVASTLGSFPRIDYSDRQHFKDAMNSDPGRIIVGAPIISRLTGEASIPIARRFDKPDGSFGGVVLVQIKSSAFEAGYKNLGLKGMDYVALLGADGIARAGNIGDNGISGRDFKSNVFAAQKIKPNDLFVAKSNTGNIRRFVAYRTLADYPLMVAFGVDGRASMRHFEKHRAEFAAIGVVTSFLVIVFAIVLGIVLFRKDQANRNLLTKEATLFAMANADFLTGLPNRAALETDSRRLLKRAEAVGFDVACLFIDLDGFNQINGALGHPAGDEVLKAVAQNIAPIFSNVGQIARIGGDEFVAIFRTEEDAEAHALTLAEKVRQSIEDLHTVAGQRIDLRASIGVSIFPRHANTVSDLIRCADAAMAASKRGLRGIPQLFSSEMDRASAYRLAIRTELAEAVTKGQLEVHYQPKIELSTKKPIGMEALVRWRHPSRGLISPAEFIPVAEESGLIIPIGAWVLKQACQDCSQLIQDGYPQFSVAVNVSALQFRQSDLVQTVRESLKAAELPASRLELELTESMIADNPAIIVERIGKLKRLGVSLALDDFGTGYSNLQYLRQFPLDVLKIDRSFVADIPHNTFANSIALAIIGLARSLGLKVVAEGIQSAAHQEFLMANGCDIGQGFLFGKPMPMDEFKIWLGGRLHPESVVVQFPISA